MKFEELDHKMRAFETAHDSCADLAHWIVARVDGRNFTRLTKEICNFEAPFDPRFRDLMVETAKHLMDCGFRAVYAHTQSDEISVLLHPDDRTFERKTRKVVSILAAEAAAAFSSRLHQPAAFDCRLSQLKQENEVVDYFRWRQADAIRNALNAHCYWAMRKAGLSPSQAAEEMKGLTAEQKIELLARSAVDFDSLPAWQRLGIGVVWSVVEVPGRNPITGEDVTAERRRLCALLELEQGADYGRFVGNLIGPALDPKRSSLATGQGTR